MTKEEKKEIRKANTEELHEWLFSLWQKLPSGTKRCKACLGPIFGDFKTIYWDHLLEKEKYPQYRLNENNIFLVCGHCHTAKTNGWPTRLHKEAMDEALKKHKEGTL